MIISARSPDCIHDSAPAGERHAASSCATCPIDNEEYRRWCEFWDSLPYVWQWDPPKPDALVFFGHWEDRATGARVSDAVVLDHLRGMGVTLVQY